MKKVSFDFDGTLSRHDVQAWAKEFIKKGFEVWIVTSRSKDAWNNSDLYEIANELGIPLERIIFTEFEFKYNFFVGKDFIFHLDDDWIELKEIDIKTTVRGIPVNGGFDWQEELFKILES